MRTKRRLRIASPQSTGQQQQREQDKSTCSIESTSIRCTRAPNVDSRQSRQPFRERLHPSRRCAHPLPMTKT